MAGTITQAKLNAAQAATAWLNAFLASGSDEERPLLNRTLSVEFFDAGVQFISTDGSLLFRTWCPVTVDGGDLPRMPGIDEEPERAVVVADLDKFARTFMQTLLSAASGDNAALFEVSLTVEPHEDDQEQAPLGDMFTRERLTLRALGQELHCPLIEDAFPNWRMVDFGIPAQERMGRLAISPRMFATIGKIKGATRVDCEFTTDESAIRIDATDMGGHVEIVRGLVMPMRRVNEKKAKANDPQQMEAADL